MNSEQQQQRIMGYFIEEAREHLQTIEQGVLNLQDVLGNTESVNELFRAAHSIKGGAAMLGVGSIQHVAHRLEDFFKILTENPQINVDERLKSLLLAGFDPLTELLEELQGGFRISDQLTNETSTRVKPVFAELESYLNQLVLDANGQVSADQISLDINHDLYHDINNQEVGDQELEEIAETSLELVMSQESVFQEEVTTRMRDMLQLFRGNDSAESRSQLQAICNYFQEIGNDFDLRNWTNLVTQVKNAIAQPTNSYRTLAPILIRELKESQDLVLSNRETEISVSSKLESLLPYRFSQPEDDEISTIFTTTSSDKAEESIGESLGIVNVEQTETISEDIVDNTVDNIYLESDTDLHLFADQSNEEAFDLTANPVEQMDWMDDEYAITEHQHIDGPKVGASELKSLAVLFENDDIDFDAAWEDIESNETHMSTSGVKQALDSHDEFADLLDNTSDSDKTSKTSTLFSEESSIEQLFGDFPTDEADAEDISNSLFPEDLDSSWDQTIEIDSEFDAEIEIDSEFDAEIENAQIENAQIENDNDRSSLDELVFSDLDADNISEKISEEISEEEFDLNLGFDIFDQIIDDQIIDDQIVDFEDFNVSEASENITETGHLIVNDFIGTQIDTQDSFDSLSSEEYFAELERQEHERQEQAIADGELSQPNEPFALTFSEEGMTLLDEPFAIDDNFDEEMLESSLSNTDGENEEFSTSEIDIFSSEAEYISPEETKSNDYILPSDSEDFDPNNTTSGLNIFDELGFDSDEIDLDVDSQDFDNNNVDSLDDFSVDPVQSSDDLAGFFESNEEIQSAAIDESDYSIFDDEPNIPDQLGDFFTESNNFAEAPVDEVCSTDDLGDFFAVSEEPELIDSSVESESNIFTPQVDSFNELNSLLANPEDEKTISSDIGGFFDQEVNNTDDLGAFFVASEESTPIIDISNSIDEINEIENELDVFSNNLGNLDNLDNFFDSSEELKESENPPEDITDRDWSDLNNDLQTGYQENNAIDTGEDSFGDFGSSQDMNSDLFETENEDTSKEKLSSAVFSQTNHSNNSDLADLFADEDAMTLLENSFSDGRSLATESDVQNSDAENSEYLDSINLPAIQFIDDHLTINQNVTDFDDDMGDDMGDYIDDAIDDITADNTIDNLADFFQVDDDSDISVLQTSESLDGGSLAVDETLDFSGFNEFSDLNGVISETLDFVVPQNLEAQNFEVDTQLQTEEFNGIDDNFDFDDLEAMIGSSNPLASEIANLRDQVPQSFSGREPLENEEHYISDDMNFDELEALLGESDTLATDDSTPTDVLEADTFIVAPEVKPLDDFDELENMLQSAFAKDVGPIKTKSSARLPTTTRKPRLTDSTMRVDVKYLDSLNNLVGELVVNRNLLEQDQERLQQFITNLLHQVQLLSDVSQRMRDQYDRSLLEASLSVGRTSSYGQKFDAYSGDNSSPISSATNDFEGIEFDRYNTFHVLSQEIIELIVRVRESASDIEFVVGETDQVTRQLGTITTQVQDDLKQSRMVPFAQIADRLPRGIRDRALKTGKQAELEIYGRETLIDKAILEQLTDPLTHLVNNAIDHGLEDPATRQAAGKSGTGRLTVRAYHQGNQTVISISDDGAGISTEKVKKSAVAKRVRTQSEVDQLNETEVYALLFEPGFSTAAQADEFKGRGVGLDVVKTCLDEIRGVIIVESLIGKGTTFTIRLPLTLSISKAMFCISDRARVAFPVDGFEDMVEVPQSQIVLNEKGQPCLPWRDTILPFQHLSNLLSYSRHLSRSNIYGKQDNDEICIIILRNDTSYLALQVDQFLGEYEIVIKQLEGPIPQPAGIAGATVLGDGRVMAIANVLELFDIASGRLRPSTSGLTIQPIVEEDVAADPTVLIVDDSITVRELLSLTFAKVGYRVEQAKDGQDAWEKLRAGLPCDMIFCDIEMPRMDGLDLLSRLQKDARLKDIPVAMLTSRGADRHRQSAIQLGAKGYFTKPYLEEELLSASKRMLNGETLPI